MFTTAGKIGAKIGARLGISRPSAKRVGNAPALNDVMPNNKIPAANTTRLFRAV
jgi:hypothetical protein